MDQVFLSTDSKQTILAANTSLQYVLGYRPEDLIGKSFRVLQGPKSDIISIQNALACVGEQRMSRKIHVSLYEANGSIKQVNAVFESYISEYGALPQLFVWAHSSTNSPVLGPCCQQNGLTVC